MRDQIKPRELNFVAVGETLKPGPKARARIIYPKDDIESFALASQIHMALAIAGWDVRMPTPILPGDALVFGEELAEKMFENSPASMAAGGNAKGVSVLRGVLSSNDARRAAEALSKALLNALGTVFTTERPFSEEVRIIVGPKP